MKTVKAFCVAVLFVAGASPAAAVAPHVDRIFVNGRIWTGDDARPAAEALAIGGDKIVAVGSTVEVRALASADTAVVDLHGRRVVPGFNDAHLHFPGLPVNVVDLSGADSLAELQRRIADYAKAHPADRWVIGRGWGYSAFPNGKPDKKYLDETVPDRPAYITERDGHMGLANSRALAVAGITRATPDPPNGRLVRDANGEPTGELQEAAQDLVESHMPEPSAEEMYAAFRQHMDEAASYGLTSVQNASWSPRDQRLAERALSEGALKLRFRFAVPILPKDGGAPEGHVLKSPLTSADIARYRELRDTFKGPLLEHGAIKGFVDGTVDARTAAMFEPDVGGGTGIPFWEQADLNSVVALYDREGFQVLLHAIGDKAIHMALDAYEYAAKTNGTSGRRHRIEHVEVPALADLPRFKQLTPQLT
jgi:predicted amidohydrolase YtcJ